MTATPPPVPVVKCPHCSAEHYRPAVMKQIHRACSACGNDLNAALEPQEAPST